MTVGLTQCFVSYAHADHKGCERLLAHLRPVAHLFGFDLWHDQKLKGGDYWHPGIEAAIAGSQAFVLLTTNDLLGSDYVLRHELPRILDAHSDRGALVVPVIYRDCAWTAFFGKYIQAVPTTDAGRLRPIMDWPRPENGFSTASRAISAAISDWFGVPPRSPMDGRGLPAP